MSGLKVNRLDVNGEVSTPSTVACLLTHHHHRNINPSKELSTTQKQENSKFGAKKSVVYLNKSCVVRWFVLVYI